MAMIKGLLTLLFCYTTCFGSVISLKEKLGQATPGSYMVMEQNKNFTFLRIYEQKGDRLSLEEVSVPLDAFAKSKMGWRAWFEAGAPGHTAWTLTRVNKSSGKVEEVFSFLHNGWINQDSSDTFMTTLLNLKFYEVPEKERRHVGLPPGYGKPDHRPLWQPRLIVEGTLLPKIPFHAWKAVWPADGSELARKSVEVYLPAVEGNFPNYFPYWLEVEGKIGSAKIRVVDSGLESHSPKHTFPHRKPQLVGQGRWESNYFLIELNNPSHLTDFIVMAQECDSLFGKASPVPFETVESGEKAFIKISREEMAKVMTLGESYRFLISSQEEASILETRTINFN